MPSLVLFRCGLKTYHLQQVKAVMEYIVGQDEVSAMPATLKRKDIQLTKPVFIWILPHALDHMSGQALYALL